MTQGDTLMARSSTRRQRVRGHARDRTDGERDDAAGRYRHADALRVGRGLEALERLTGLFYSRVPQDPILAPVFREMAHDHPPRVARFLAEVRG
jgi:hypothetical protein